MNTVLITGVGRGIGKAEAEKFLDEGYRVFGTTTSGASDLTHENLQVFALDLRSAESIERCAGQVAETGITLDIVINNAGVLLDEDDTVLIPEKLRATLEVNLIGTAAFTERVLPLVAKDGIIVMTSSAAGSIELAGRGESHDPGHYPAYKISKAALNMYMRTLAIRLKPQGTTVISVHPGWVRTDMGGEEATMSPEEAADTIYKRVTNPPETGTFWFGDTELPW